MIVSMWMSRDVVTIAPGALVAEAARIMARRGIRRLPVVKDGAGKPRLVGITSTHDILHAFPPDVNPFCVADPRLDQNRLTVSEIMSYPVLTANPDTPIEEAARLLGDARIGSLPVMKDSQLVGLITESDIFRAFTAMLALDKSGFRITWDVSNGEDVFPFVADAARRHGLRVASIVTCEWEGRHLTVVQVVGADRSGFVDELWKSGHNVLSVLPGTRSRSGSLPLRSGGYSEPSS